MVVSGVSKVSGFLGRCTKPCGEAKKRKGSSSGAPLPCSGWLWLENYANAKLQLPHAVWRTGRSIGLNVGNLAGTAGAVEAGVALVRVEAQNRVVEDVVGVKAELCRDAFGDRKVLRERKVAREAARPGKGVEVGIA